MPMIDFPKEGYQELLTLIHDVVTIEQATENVDGQKALHVLATDARKRVERLADMLESDN